MTIWLLAVLTAGLAGSADAGETRYRLLLAGALSGEPAVVDLLAMDGKFTAGDVGIAPADVTAVVRDGDKLRGKVKCTLDGTACWFEVDAVVREQAVEGKYSGARGEAQISGAVTGTVATAAFPPSPEHPVGWRGDGTGDFAFTNPPIKWAPGEWPPGAKNLRWRAKFGDGSAWSNAQPIVVGKRVFVFHEPTTMACLDDDTGAVLWQKDMNLLWTLRGEEFTKSWAMWQERQKAVEGYLKKDPEATAKLKELDAVLVPKVQYFGEGCQQKYLKGYGFATPVSDGTLVYVKNGTGMLAAVDLDGNVKWARNIGYNGGHSSVASPCLVDGRLIVWNSVANGKPHILSCFDAKTGNPLWQTEPRPPGATDGCASPIVLRLKGVPVILTACGDIVRAADGKILGKELHAQGYISPAFHDDVVFFATGGKPVVEAVRLTLTGETVTATKLWTAKQPLVDGKGSALFAGHVYYQGYLYMLQSRGQFSVMDASTGELKCAQEVHPGKMGECYPGLAVAGGRVYCFDLNGRSAVVEAGPKGEVIARNDCLGGGTASPFIVGSRIYVRNSQKKWMPSWTYCIEEGH